MKKIVLSLLVFASLATKAQVGIGLAATSVDPSAQLEVKSTAKGFLPPRMSAAQRDAISSPAAGLVLWCIDCGAKGELQVHNGSEWTNMVGGATSNVLIVPTVTPIVGTYIFNGSAQGPNSATNDGTGTSYTYSYNGTGGTSYGPSATPPSAQGNYAVIVTVAPNGNYAGASSAATLFTIEAVDLTPRVTIGTQVWTTQNLNVSTYLNGDPIPKVEDAGTWASLTTGAYCYYNNDSATYASVYGKLYNWYAVNDSRGLAPAGYHVPTDAEWTTLTTTLGGESVASGKMKEAGTSHWNSPNAGADNSSGFNALPGGYRDNNGGFTSNGTYAAFNSATEFDSPAAYLRLLMRFNASVARNTYLKTAGFSVRLVHD
jgi:uncharacterized protein (TIGR02145 family)